MTSSIDRAANVAQARVFVEALEHHIDKVSANIEQLEKRSVTLRARGHADAARMVGKEAGELRTELYAIHRQLDRLHDDFPELLGRR